MLSSGRILNGRYEILEKIGSGGMAVVFRGKDNKLDRSVTIKVLKEEYISDAEFVERFKSEACSAARLNHPNIVRVYDENEDDGIYYIVMEYVHGDTLKKAIEEKAPFDSKSTLQVALQIAAALSHAHKNHIVHRDIKPQNILIGTDGMVKVTDFGIARAATNATLITSNTAGSVHYFSPEQARGGYVDEKSDIYSLGITMFEMATGRLPFQAETSVAVALKHMKEELPNIFEYNPRVSKNLVGIIRKATQKRADERYANIEQMLSDLVRARAELTDAPAKPKAVSEPDIVKTEAPPPEMPTPIPVKRKPLPDVSIQSNVPRAKPQPEIAIPKSVTNQEKQHRLQISKDDDFEKEYEEVEPLQPKKTPKPQKKMYVPKEGASSQERNVVIAAVVTALVIIAAISFAGLKMLGGGPLVGGEVVVPSFVGQPFQEAQNTASKLGIRLVQAGQEESMQYDADVIIAQTVDQGASVKKGTKLEVTVSSGLQLSSMPNLLGKKEKAALDTIAEKVGTDDIQVTYVNHETADAGTVTEQSPKQGDKVNAKSQITLVVSKGKDSQSVMVPSVVGMTEQRARSAIEGVGLVVGSVSQLESDTVEKGRVITQTLPANQEVAENSVVGLVVSSGKAETTPEPQTPEEPQAPEDPQTPNTPPSQTEQPEEPAETSSTRVFSINAPQMTGDSVNIRIVKTEDEGLTDVILDEAKSASDFPFGVSITGTGKAKVQCYVDGKLLWTESVNFSEGGN